jgi:outer membrane protein TolC
MVRAAFIVGCLAFFSATTLCAQTREDRQTSLPQQFASTPKASEETNRFSINLPTALQLAQANPLDIALAGQRLEAAVAQHERAKSLWLPTLYGGMDYARHDGRIQDIVGNVFGTSRHSLMFGTGAGAVFSLSEAFRAPLAARQLVRAREADVQATVNDAFLAVAEAYFGVQQARGEVAGAADAVARATDLLQRAEKLTPALAPALEASRARTELSRRKQALETAYERWHIASAELARLLRLQPGVLVDPVEPPHLDIQLLDIRQPVDELIPVALTNRPELASRQAFVEATLQRLKQERQRPLIPSVLLRGNATNPGGTLSGGAFGGGVNGDMKNFGSRHSFDLQIVWEFQNLLAGNKAAVKERRAENQQAVLELFRTQDRIAAEVVQALAQAKAAAVRMKEAREGVQFAKETTEQSLEGLRQTRRAGDLVVLVVRPSEAVSAVQGLAQAFADYYTAIADHNRAQFRLYRALGQPAQELQVTVEPKTPSPFMPPPER